MRLHHLPLADADRGTIRLVALCLAGVAVLALGAFAFTEIVPARAQTSTRAPSMPTMTPMTPMAVLPTVPQASDVLPAAPALDEPEIATHGG